LADREMEEDTLMLRTNGTFVKRSSKLKQVANLQEWFLAIPLLEDSSIANGRMLVEERIDHQHYMRRIAEYDQYY
jgi:hypothetical protein